MLTSVSASSVLVLYTEPSGVIPFILGLNVSLQL